MQYRVLIDGGKETDSGWSGSRAKLAVPHIVVSFGAVDSAE